MSRKCNRVTYTLKAAVSVYQRCRELKRAEIPRSDHGLPHSLYSIRHTALCMRLVKSKGKVNILNLAKSAGTSTEQLERFYLRNLPPSAELAHNLQTFGDE